MAWVLIFIALGDSGYATNYYGHYQTMEDCMAAREALIEDVGRPIINYQAVCVPQKIGETL